MGSGQLGTLLASVGVFQLCLSATAGKQRSPGVSLPTVGYCTSVVVTPPEGFSSGADSSSLSYGASSSSYSSYSNSPSSDSSAGARMVGARQAARQGVGRKWRVHMDSYGT